MKLRFIITMLVLAAIGNTLHARDITPQRTQKAIDRFVDDSLMRHGSVGVIVVWLML